MTLPDVRRQSIVDDNADAAESLALLLDIEGNETQTASDGVEAVEVAATFRPDVVLLDIGLPKLNGYEAARKIRDEPWGRGMVLVALTGWAKREIARSPKPLDSMATWSSRWITQPSLSCWLSCSRRRLERR